MNDETEKRLRSPYGPIRTTACSWSIPIAQLAKAGHINAMKGTVTSEFGHFVAENVLRPYFDASAQMGDDPEIAAHLQAKIFAMGSWTLAWAHFVACGREIFELTPELIEEFKNSDLGDTSLDLVKPPYPAFYVRFGRQQDLSLPWEQGKREYLDGAYFSFQEVEGKAHPSILICLTTTLDDGLGFLTPGPEFLIDGDLFELPVAEAVERSAIAAVQRFAKLSSKLHANEGGVLSSMGDKALEHAQENADLVKRCLPLLVHTLYYLTDPPKLDRRPGLDTPKEILKKIENAGSPKAKRKANAQLLSMGYAVVKLCGTELSHEPATSGEGAGRRAHWRRGHWRRQRFGEGFSQQRLIRIRPTLVNADIAHGNEPGRIYKAGSNASSAAPKQ
jgi:hypothetical protein